jgi:hypothetical protein
VGASVKGFHPQMPQHNEKQISLQSTQTTGEQDGFAMGPHDCQVLSCTAAGRQRAACILCGFSGEMPGLKGTKTALQDKLVSFYCLRNRARKEGPGLGRGKTDGTEERQAEIFSLFGARDTCSRGGSMSTWA